MSHPVVSLDTVRILHTSDWHLGRNFHGVGLLDAQLSVLEAVVDLVKAESVDVVVIAGDIYDRAIPSADVVRSLSELLCAIRGAGATVVGISGNHDSAERIGFAEAVMSRSGVSLRGDIAAAGTPVLVPQSDGNSAVAFYPVPYLEVDRARFALDEPELRTHDRLLGIALDRARADLTIRPNTRGVAIVHAFVTGGTSCDSELALSVGGSAEVPLRCLSGFDYVALGHLHRRQSLGSGRARYAGSPLPYSFSERDHDKGAWLIDLPSRGDVRVTPVELPVHRPLHQLSGTLDDLLTDTTLRGFEEGFVHAVLTDNVLPMHAMARLRRRFPHAVLLSHEPPTRAQSTASYAIRIKNRNDLELASDFLEHAIGRPPTAEEMIDLTEAVTHGSNLEAQGDTAKAVA